MEQYVVVHNNGSAYTIYDEFFKENDFEKFTLMWARGKTVPQDEAYKIVGIGRHSRDGGVIFMLEHIETKKIYLFGTYDPSYYTMFNHKPERVICWK